MFGQALAWFVVQTLCLVTLVASQTRLIYPANDAPDRSTMVLRGRSLLFNPIAAIVNSWDHRLSGLPSHCTV